MLRQVFSKEIINEDGASSHEQLNLELWTRGMFDARSMRLGPVSYVRRDVLRDRDSPYCDMGGYCSFRGGSQSTLDFEEQTARKIGELGAKFGQGFFDAIERNKREHADDCKKSCEMYFCAKPDAPLKPFEEFMGDTTMASYSMGPVPPEDFAESFG